MSNIVDFEDLKKSKLEEKEDFSSKAAFLQKVENSLVKFVTNVSDEETPAAGAEATLQSEKLITKLNIAIMYYKPEGKKITFDEWLAEEEKKLTIDGVEHTDIRIVAPYAFGVLIKDLGDADFISFELLHLLVYINSIALNLNRKSVMMPVLYQESGVTVYGITFVLESDNKVPVILIMTVTNVRI